jgi:biotin transport system substrate-specific component
MENALSLRRPATLIDATLPPRTLARQALLVAGSVVLLALASQISWDLPFSRARDGSVVPVTGQTFAVLLIGATMGARLAGVSVFAYMTAGVAGAPVFADWSRYYTGMAGPSGGYIIGFFFAAVLVGWFAERGWDRSNWILLPMFLGNAVIYVPGLIWLNQWMHVTHLPGVDWGATLDFGLWPFVAGDAVKLIAAALALPAAWSLVGRMRS